MTGWSSIIANVLAARVSGAAAVLAFILGTLGGSGASPAMGQDVQPPVEHAETSDPPDGELAVAIRMDPTRDQALLQRIRGQTVDLAVRLVPVATSQLERTLPEQLNAADRLAEATDSDAVLWFIADETRGALVLMMVVRSSGRVLVRNVQHKPGQPADSAALETAGLVIRGDVAALIAGTTIGEERQVVIDAAAPEEGQVRALEETPPSGPAAGPEPSSLSLHGRLGWQVGWHGKGAWFHGVMGGAAVRFGPIELGLSGVFGMPNELENGELRWSASRHDATVHAGVFTSLTREAVLGLRLRGGVALFGRGQLRVQGGFEPTADERWLSPLAGAAVHVDVEPHALGGFGFSAGLSIDVLPRAPNYGTEVRSTFGSVRTLWKVAPRAFVAAVF